MKLPYNRSMYAEHTDKHFKLYCPIKEENMFVNIYLKKSSDKNIPNIFKELMDKYQESGMTPIESAMKAQSVLNDFFDACVSLGEKRIWPFKLRITGIDPKRFNNENK